MSFKFKLGIEAKSRTTEQNGIITARAETLFGADTYYLQPRVNQSGVVPDGTWLADDDCLPMGSGIHGLPDYAKDDDPPPVAELDDDD
jgi:hypothetical protein